LITVGKAAKMFGLSRTALLYYDSIGLLKVKRADNGYRQYSDDDIERLRQIISLRSSGVPLTEISEYLDSAGSDTCSILLKRLGDINREIEKNRSQQGIIIKLLKNTDIKQKRQYKTEEWMEILLEAGVDSGNALKWHFNFEMQSPEQHRSLLVALGFSRDEIARFKEIYDTHYKADVTSRPDYRNHTE
jgi:DNA-binding transcriptional MerR regulator